MKFYKNKKMEVNGIQCEPAEYYDEKFAANPLICTNEWSKERNQTILDWIKNSRIINFPHLNIIEFAAGTGEFADMLMKQTSFCGDYFHTDFSKVVCDIAKENLKNFDNIEIQQLDIYSQLNSVDFDKYSFVICNSMEHFPVGIDYDILNKLTGGKIIIFSMATFPIEESHSHPHIYPNIEYVKERYKDYLNIQEIKLICSGAVITLMAIKK